MVGAVLHWISPYLAFLRHEQVVLAVHQGVLTGWRRLCFYDVRSVKVLRYLLRLSWAAEVERSPVRSSQVRLSPVRSGRSSFFGPVLAGIPWLDWHDNDSVAQFQFSCPELREIGLRGAGHVVSCSFAGGCSAGHGSTIARAAGSCTRLHPCGQFLLFVTGFSSGFFFEVRANKRGAGWIHGRSAGAAAGQNFRVSLGKQFSCSCPGYGPQLPRTATGLVHIRRRFGERKGVASGRWPVARNCRWRGTVGGSGRHVSSTARRGWNGVRGALRGESPRTREGRRPDRPKSKERENTIARLIQGRRLIAAE